MSDVLAAVRAVADQAAAEGSGVVSLKALYGAVRSDEIVDQLRWSVVHHIVFEHEDGTLWRVKYYEPATEMQECDPWGYRDEPKAVEAVQVEPYEVTVTKYRPVEASVEATA